MTSSWQPMEAAPRDERILVADRFGKVLIARWEPLIEEWLNDETQVVVSAALLEAWQPLPPPPAAGIAPP